jgi:hypothetical protein
MRVVAPGALRRVVLGRGAGIVIARGQGGRSDRAAAGDKEKDGREESTHCELS